MNEDQKAGLLDRLIENPPDREALLTDAGATAEERKELIALAQVADAAWLTTRGAPPLDEDPIAAMLGVSPSASVTIDPAHFKSARTRSGVSVSELRERLVARGWTVTTAEVASWQTRVGIELVPAVVDDISEALAARAEDFIKPHSDGARSLHAALRTAEWFNAVVEQWQVAKGVARGIAEAQLLVRATATVHRGEEPDVEQIRGLLERLVVTDRDGGRPQS